MLIYVELDDDNVVTGWGTSREEGLAMAEVPEDHPIITLTDFFGNYVYKNGRLIKNTDLELNNLKNSIKETLNNVCTNKILDGFEYEFISDKKYHVSYSRNKQQYFEEVKSMFGTKTISQIKWEFINSEGNTIYEDLDELAFLTLYTYASLVKTAKMTKLKEKLFPLVDQANDRDELLKITWDSITDEVIDKPIIDLNGDGQISQEEFDALVKENKELKQKVEFNELALMDAVNMLSSMIKQ